MATVGAHVTPDQLGSFLAGALAKDATADVEAHIDACEACRQLISETVRQRHAQQAALAPTMMSQSDAKLPVVVGDVVDGRYRIERLLGVGGMGCVFEAHHTHLNQRMALKFMLPELIRDPNAVDRFTREARAAVRLVTDHVGRVLDLGVLPSGTPYLVMEFLQGETVEQRLAREGPFQKGVAIRVVRDAMEALAEAHDLGIVHRDLKPANLFLSRRSSGVEVVKVLDFGIAKSIDPDIEAGLGNTSRRTLLGSPLYMAPEQLSGRDVDAKVDVWALGCTLYQLLTGETPFRGNDLVELMFAIQTRPHVPLALRVPAAKSLSAVVDACLQKDPLQRVSSMAALRAMLDAAEAQDLAEAVSVADAPPAAARASPGSVRALPAAPSPVRWVAVGAGLVLLGALGWKVIAQSRTVAAPPSLPAPRPVTVSTQVAEKAPAPPPPEARAEEPTAVVRAPVNPPAATKPLRDVKAPPPPAVPTVTKAKAPPSPEPGPPPPAPAKRDVLDDRL